ncbi:protein of unknown function [Xenorhabdus nematophila AN6/1]|nr:hypothetical protein XNA1_2190018 [Xenorhabdus nematophila str. Anatoliense]CEF32065.1 hypothetical protein XNW1_4220029 [Xenorhabdus nematophila str. Websteri]CEK23719.1 protein of unknown function [Xenorhabdus nematophila AN6/1]
MADIREIMPLWAEWVLLSIRELNWQAHWIAGQPALALLALFIPFLIPIKNRLKSKVILLISLGREIQGDFLREYDIYPICE